MATAAWGIEIDGGYFHEEAHLYRCTQGIIRPSATQVFDILGCSDFKNIPEKVLEWKRTYGNAIHIAGQYLPWGQLDWDSLDDVILPAVTGIDSFLREYEFEPESTEELKIRSLYGMQYGTRLDLKGTIKFRGKRRHCILDYKTAARTSKTWDWQLGGYYAEQPAVEGGWIGVIAQVDPEGFVEPHWVLDLEKQKREFQVLLSAAILKLNNGMAKLAAA